MITRILARRRVTDTKGKIASQGLFIAHRNPAIGVVDAGVANRATSKLARRTIKRAGEAAAVIAGDICVPRTARAAVITRLSESLQGVKQFSMNKACTKQASSSTESPRIEGHPHKYLNYMITHL